MSSLSQRLAAQVEGIAAAEGSTNKRGLRMRVFQLPCKVNDWTEVLPVSKDRQFLIIQARPGDNGPVKMEVGFDSRSRSNVWNVEGDTLEFSGGIAPINAVNVYVTSEYGDTIANIQVIEG